MATPRVPDREDSQARAVHGLGVQQRTDLLHRAGQLQVGLAVDGDRPCGRVVQTQDQPHGGGLAGPVRAEKTGHQAGADHEAETVDRDGGAVPLDKTTGLDHRASSLDSAVVTALTLRTGAARRQPAATHLQLGGNTQARSGRQPQGLAGSGPGLETGQDRRPATADAEPAEQVE